MAKEFRPPYVQDAKLGQAVLTGANTARDGSGTITELCTIGADDGYVKKVRFIPAQASAAATTAKVFLLFYSLDSGTTWHFFEEVASPTSTPSNTAVAAASTKVIAFPDGFVPPAGTKLGCAQTVYAGVQDRTQVTIEYSDY